MRLQGSPELQRDGETLVIKLAKKEGEAWSERAPTEIPFHRIEGWPLDIPVTGDGYDAETPLEIVAEVYGDGPRPLVQVRALTSFVPREQRVLELVLQRCGDLTYRTLCELDADCHGATCLTCEDGSCAEAGFSPGRDLPRFDVDAGAVPATFLVDEAAVEPAEEAGGQTVDDADTPDGGSPVCADDDCGAPACNEDCGDAAVEPACEDAAQQCAGNVPQRCVDGVLQHQPPQ